MATKPVSTLEKSLEILELFLVDKKLTVSDMAEKLQQPKSTIYRHVEALCQKGYLAEDDLRGYYHLGLKILHLSRNVVNNRDVVQVARPIMEQLRNQTGETVVLASLYGTKAIYLEQFEATHILRATYEPKRILPLYVGASSKILMAYLSESEINQVIEHTDFQRFTVNTITDPERLKEHLREIRKRGYAYSTEEAEYGTRGVGVPIFNLHHQVVASLSVSGPTQRLDDHTLERLRDQTIEAGKMISDKLSSKS